MHSFLALMEWGQRVHIQIHTQTVPQLIGHQLGIDAGLPAETGMRASHDLKRGLSTTAAGNH